MSPRDPAQHSDSQGAALFRAAHQLQPGHNRGDHEATLECHPDMGFLAWELYPAQGIAARRGGFQSGIPDWRAARQRSQAAGILP